MVGLSGSTWAISNLLIFAGSQTNVEVIRSKIFDTIKNEQLFDPLLNKQNLSTTIDAFLVRMAADQPFSPTSLYGTLLSNIFFKNRGSASQRVYLADQIPMVSNGNWPIPIYTAVQGESGVAQNLLEWYEFTPWEVGGAWLSSWVPSWAYGNKFNHGQTTVLLGENLGFNLATFGTAYAGSINDAVARLQDQIKSSPSVEDQALVVALESLQKIKPAYVLEGTTFFTTVVNNFMYGMPQSKLKNEYLYIMDGGIAFNFPYPPISGERADRKADIIIYVDFTETPGLALTKAVNYAQRKKLKFPPIDITNIAKNSISVFVNNNDPTVPVVIYMPLTGAIADCVSKNTCGTFAFKYDVSTMNTLSNAMRDSVKTNKNTIITAINNWIAAVSKG